MRLADDAEAAVWLLRFDAILDDFDWDDGNGKKNLKHGVSCEEVEAVVGAMTSFFAGRIVEPAHDEWRVLIVGPTQEGRLLALVFTRRGDSLRPISCRPARASERRLYEEKGKRYS